MLLPFACDRSMKPQKQQGMFKTCPEPTPKEGALSKA